MPDQIVSLEQFTPSSPSNRRVLLLPSETNVDDDALLSDAPWQADQVHAPAVHAVIPDTWAVQDTVSLVVVVIDCVHVVS